MDRILETFPKKLCKNLIEKLHIVNFLDLCLNNDVKIYDGRQYAQGFYPYIENLTRIELPISVEEKKRFIPLSDGDEELGDLIVSICSDRDGYPGDVILSKRFSYEEVKGNGKVVWELEKEYTLVRPADDPYWQEHGLEPKNERYGRKLYYIVVTAEGGYDKENSYCYYVWKAGTGSGNENARNWYVYYKEKEGDWQRVFESWKYLDFAIYGCLAWEKPGDGIENHYGLFCSPYGPGSYEKIKRFASLFKGENIVWRDTDLEHRGYHAEEIYALLDLIDAKSDADDVVVFFILGDGGHQWISGVTARAVAERFGRMNVKGICAIFSACYSGSFVEYFKDEKWDGIVVISSCSKDEMDHNYVVNDERWPTALVYFMYEYMYKAREKGRKVTAEKAFEYIQEKTRGWPNLHPQMYDAYPTRENNKEELEI